MLSIPLSLVAGEVLAARHFAPKWSVPPADAAKIGPPEAVISKLLGPFLTAELLAQPRPKQR
jgi:hypothetical protein